MKPRKTIAPLSSAMQWQAGPFLCQRKYDGQFCRVPFRAGASVGELLAEWVTLGNGSFRTASDIEHLKQSPGGFFAALRIASLNGQDMLRVPNGQAWRELQAIHARGEMVIDEKGPFQDVKKMTVSRRQKIVLPEIGNGGEFIEQVLAAGGEGVCAHDLDQPWGEMFAAVLLEQYVCRVTDFCGAKQSVAIAFANGPNEGRQAGHVPLLGGKIDRVRVGSLLKIEGKRLTLNGLIREPRVCQDNPNSWLIQY